MEEVKTEHIINVWWEDETGYSPAWMSSSNSSFHKDLQELVAQYGPPTRIEFEAEEVK